MDIITISFVGGLCLIALFLTITVRRELIAKEHQHRVDRRQSRPARRKP